MGSGEILDATQPPGNVKPGTNDTLEVTDTSLHAEKVTVPGEHVMPQENVTQMAPSQTVSSTLKSSSVDSTTVGSTNKSSTVTPIVVVPDKSPKPPYVIVTDPEHRDSTTAYNMTANVTPSTKSSHTGAIIGVVVSLLLIGIIIAILIILMKKKKLKVPKKVSVKRKKVVTKMENPQYKGTGKDYRFSRDSALHISNTVNLTKFNNPNLADTPVPRVLQSESPSTAKRSSLPKSIASRRDKRKAPPPPNPFGDDDELYEKASHGSAEVELQTFSVQNENATDIEKDEQVYPLLKRHPSSKEKNRPADNNDNTRVSTDPESDHCFTSDPGESLLPKEKSSSQDQLSTDVTLDDYDLTKNPFFAKV